MADLTKPFKKFTTHSAFRLYINSNMTIPDGIATCDEVPLLYAGGKQYGGMIYDIDSHTSEETNVLMGIINWTATGIDTALSFKLKYGGVIYNPIKYSLQDSVVSITACKSSVSGDTLSFADFKHTMDDGWVITEFSLPLVNSGDGTKFLSDNGSYKEIAGGSQIYALQMARSITNTGTYNRLLLSQYNDGSLTINAGDMLMLRRAATSTFNTSLPFSVYVNGTDVPVVDATNTAVTANHIVSPMPVGYYTFILSDDGKLVLQNPTLSAATVNTALEEIINQ